MFKPKSLRITNVMSFKDQSFEFRNGEAIAVIGINLDDSGQKVNGAGKTAFIESVSICLSGSPLRSVKTKEIINNSSDSAEIELVLFNTRTEQSLKIWRKIYGNTKSAEYKSWIYPGQWQGEDKVWLELYDQCKSYSDFNDFNAFVWKTIGISKEDFFSFYLITREQGFEPFLKLTDVPKKEIINRFSGANKTDVVFPHIEIDADIVKDQVANIEKQLLSNTTKQELLMQSLVEEEAKVSDEHKNEVIADKENQLLSLEMEDQGYRDAIFKEQEAHYAARDKVVTFESEQATALEPFSDAMELAKLELEAFEFTKNYDTEIQTLVDQSKTLHADKKIKEDELPAVKLQFQPEIDAILAEEKGLREQLTTDELSLKEFEQFESDVNKKLQDAIECPSCHHKFSLRDKEFNVEEATAALPEVIETISGLKIGIADLKSQINTDIQQKKTEVNQKIITAGEGIKNAITEFNKQIIATGQSKLILEKEYQVEKQNKQNLANAVTAAQNALDNKKSGDKNNITVLNNAIRRCEINLKNKEQEYTDYQKAVANLKLTIENLRTAEPDKTRVADLEKKITDLITEEEEIKVKLEEKRKEKERIDAWEINFKNFKSYLANKSIKNIQDYTNLFLDSMGSNLAIVIDGYRTLANKKIKEQITTTVLRDGFDAGSYGKFSGGEQGRINISNVIGIQELVNNASPTGGLDLLIVDEVLDQVDVIGLEAIIGSLQTLGKTIMIVSQNDGFALKQFTMTIQKKDKISTILQAA